MCQAFNALSTLCHSALTLTLRQTLSLSPFCRKQNRAFDRLNNLVKRYLANQQLTQDLTSKPGSKQNTVLSLKRREILTIYTNMYIMLLNAEKHSNAQKQVECAYRPKCSRLLRLGNNILCDFIFLLVLFFIFQIYTFEKKSITFIIREILF